MNYEKPLEIPNVNSLKVDVNDFDAIAFFREPEGQYTFNIMKLREEPTDYEVFDMGHKFFIMFINENDTCELSEAVLSDPLYMIKSYVRSDIEGIIIKKSSKGKDLLDKMLFKSTINRLADALTKVAEQKAKEV